MKLVTKNRKAYYEYTILDKHTAGIQLKGSEVKSIKRNEVNIAEAYCFIENDEIFIKNMYIAEHKEGGPFYNHEPFRLRKLLLKKKEILNLNEKAKIKGLTIIPLSVILTETGFVKLEIGLAKGKNIYNKKNSIKEKDLKRDFERGQ